MSDGEKPAPPAKTFGEYERRLRRILVERVETIEFMRSDQLGGEIEFEGDDITHLRIDPFWRAIGKTVIHELTHFERRANPEAAGVMDEPDTLGREEALWKFVMRSKCRWRWWRREIYARLKGAL